MGSCGAASSSSAGDCRREPRKTLSCLPAILDNLAWLAEHRGDVESAENFYSRSFEANVAVFGIEHPDCVHALRALARIASRQSSPRKARRIILGAFEIAKRSLDPGHPRLNEILETARAIFERADPKLRDMEQWALIARA